MSPTGPTPPLAWSYWTRVVVLLAIVVGLVAVAVLAPPSDADITRSTTRWIVLVVPLVVGAGWLLGTRILTRGAADHPGPWLTGKTWQLWVILVLLVVPTAILGQWARPTSGPNIVRLELAGSQAVAARLDYGQDGVIHAALRGDYGFIAGYVLVLFLLVRWAGCYFRLEGVRRARVPLSFAVVGAGLLDVAENLCIRYADRSVPPSEGNPDELLWELAATCAWAKFTILIVAIGFVLCGAWSWLFTPRWVREASWSLGRPVPSTDEVVDLGATRPHQTPYGIALSGGGIRASAISLGALQVLEIEKNGQPGLGWDRASVVTAVSGGSNMAAGWSMARSSYQTDTYGCADRADPSADPRPWSLGPEMTKEEQHLFANLGYLLASSPRATAGSSEAPASAAQQAVDASPAGKAQRYRPSAIATVLTGFAINVAVFVAVLWVVVTPFGWMLASLNGGPLHGADYKHLVARHHLAFPGLLLIVVGLVLLLAWVLLGQLQWMSKNLDSNRTKQGLFQACKIGGFSLLGLGVVLLLVLIGLPLLASWLDTGGLRTLAGAAAGAAGVLGSVGRILKKPGAKYAPYLGGIAFAFFAVLVAGAWTARAARLDLEWTLNPGPDRQTGLLWLLAIAALAVVPLFISPERWSLAGFYRSKLRIAYGTYRASNGDLKVYANDSSTEDKHAREPWLHSLRQDGRPTTPLSVCGTATVSSRSVRTHYGIPALSVTFDPGCVTVHVPTSDKGAWAVYRAPTEVVNAMGTAGRKRLTTMMAVAIASAAVSPAMGRVRVGPTSMLLAFANVRLGVWMPNPRYANAYKAGAGAGAVEMSELSTADRANHPIGYPQTGMGHLFKEFLGIHDLSDPYLYMTDGGHWENTGLVEMLRRRDIHEIVCIDADCGSLGAATSLGKVLDLAPLECGVSIQINLDPLRARAGEVGPGYADRTVAVGFFRQGHSWAGDVGVLWYAKPGLSEDMSATLLGFRETHADFPIISTVDQFFDSSTYVAYRELGRHNGRAIKNARRQLVGFLKALKLQSTAEEVVLTSLDTDPGERPWVVQELVHAVHVVPQDERMAFLVAIEQALAATTAADPSAPGDNDG